MPAFPRMSGRRERCVLDSSGAWRLRLFATQPDRVLRFHEAAAREAVPGEKVDRGSTVIPAAQKASASATSSGDSQFAPAPCVSTRQSASGFEERCRKPRTGASSSFRSENRSPVCMVIPTTTRPTIMFKKFADKPGPEWSTGRYQIDDLRAARIAGQDLPARRCSAHRGHGLNSPR